MVQIQSHLRNTFLAGIIATIPVAVTAVAIWYVEKNTRFLSERAFGHGVPFLGILIAVVLIYAIGLIVRSVLGKAALRIVDALLFRVPGLKAVYSAWKHVAITPGNGPGMFSQVVLIEIETGIQQLGFTNGAPTGADGSQLFVFVHACPNPMNGNLFLVSASRCTPTGIAAEEAFKMILSTGNYVATELQQASKPH